MNDWIKNIAPLVGAALGGPLGGVAATFLADKLGLESKTVEAVTEVLNGGKMTPDQVSAIRLADFEFKKFLEVNKIKIEEIAAQDRDSARAMQIATHSKMPAVLTVMVTVGFFGVLSLLFFHPELKGNEIVMVMVGQLSAVWAGCVAFYTGTTFGSANKNALLAAK